MSADGWSAINLNMPPRIPRTEYSADSHWELVSAVTGLDVTDASPGDIKAGARFEFMKAWHYDFYWSTLINRKVFGEMRTRMGHAVYAAGGTDFDAGTTCPFKEPEQVLSFDPREKYGSVDIGEAKARFEEHYRSNCRRNPGGVNMTGVYITCLSGMIEIFGWEMLLLAAGTDPERFCELINRYAEWIQPYFTALGMADVPVVMIHDDIVWSSGPFLHPAWYRKYIFPHYVKYFDSLRESGKKIIFTSDGNYSMFIDDLVRCGVNGFVLEPFTDLKYIAEKYGSTHVFIGNADTRILLNGSREDIALEVERCISTGKEYPGYFMAVGNHIPPNTPVEAALYYNHIYRKMSKRV